MIERCIKIIREGGELDFNQAMELAQKASLADLCDAAVELCHDVHGNSFDLCSIINARSGKCSEDCRYCAQSIHHTTNIKSYDQIDSRTAIAQARENDAYGVNRLSLVTAGRSLNPSQIEGMGSLYDAMAEKTTLRFCASMGFLTKESARQLVSFGVGRYHCNLESCRDFFPSICTTHTWEEKVETLKIARDAGMDLCSGGIIGMGETLEHRLQLAFELRGLGVLSIPVNILSPIASTPLAHIEAISLEDVLRCVALFRFVNPHAVIRIAGGRGRFGHDQYRLFAAGANGAIVGDYLTTAGAGVTEDIEEFIKLGFDLSGKQ
ncbi:biotin synthase [Desulfocapsa sulfexigens DSM 10523]|uniref:Biotin synthase n=1 Tax=Desulfocapsa sulfexigens (strain DSM 10523 / SB164P1) TaxID=1167006 RepID=M1NK09_DESSD|nr:biotin synthase BioB [Desulfocapsa sulfexigens]AGF79924.1 biotin synthase [Desulfocapsa sulfexigens DSM 10523]